MKNERVEVPANVRDGEDGIKEGSEFGGEELDAVKESLSKVRNAIEDALMGGTELPHLEKEDRHNLQSVLERLQGRIAQVEMVGRSNAKEHIEHLLTDLSVVTVEMAQADVANALLYTAQTLEQVTAVLDAIPNLIVRNSDRYATKATMTGGVEAGKHAMKIAATERQKMSFSRYDESPEIDPKKVEQDAAEMWQQHVDLSYRLTETGNGFVENRRESEILKNEPVSDWVKN